MRLLTDPRLRGWRLLIVAAAAFTVGVVAIAVARVAGAAGLEDYAAAREQTTSDFRDYWFTALHFRQTGQISTEFGVHNYLPFFTVFMLPWSFVPLPLATGLFVLLSMALFAATVLLTQSLLNDSPGRRPRAATLVALALAVPYVASCAVLGNVGLLLVFLVVAAWLLMERGREWEAGAALGLATLIKLLPALLIVFFLLKRRWRLAGGATAVCLVLGFGLPLATLGFRGTVAAHATFYSRALREGSAYATIISDQPVKANYSNISLPIVLRRLLSPVSAGKAESPHGLFVNIADVPRPTIFAAYVTAAAMLLAVSGAAALRGSRSWPPDTIAGVRALRAQFGLWCCLMLLLAPLLWTHYLPLAFWPLAVLADRAERTRLAVHRVCWTSAAALGVWLAGALLLAWPAARASGTQLLGVVCLWAALVWSSLRSR